MTLDNLNQALHISGSYSASVELMRLLGLSSEQIFVNEDYFCCGPAPATEDLSVWRSIRERFLREVYADAPDFSFDECDEYASNGLLMNVDRLTGSDEIVIWLATGLSDQILLAFIMFLFDRMGLDPSRVWVIQFENLGGGRDIMSVGELRSEDIRDHQPKPRQLNPVEIQTLRRAWKVYTSDDPANLPRYLSEVGPMPILRHAMRYLVYRYPDVRSGIGSIDESLLRYTKERNLKAARIVGDAMGHNETPDGIGDQYLFHRLVSMGNEQLKSPLVHVVGNTRRMRRCEVGITTFGQKVLAGETNNVERNGIDDWIGGVHLKDGGTVIFREGDSLILS